MLQLVNFVLSLFVLLPWWAALGVIAGIVLALFAGGWYVVHRLRRDLTDIALNMGKPMEDAIAQIHSVTPAPMPEGPSSIDADEDDENYDPELDGDWDDEGCRFFWIDATITPQPPETLWDPTTLVLVNADWSPEEDLEICEETGIPHTVEVWREGRFAPLSDGLLTGPQRLRMLFAVPENSKDVKFGYHFTYFGRLTLPAAGSAALVTASV